MITTEARANLAETLWQGACAENALQSLGLSCESYQLVTTLPTPHSRRCAFRVQLSDGPTIKLRRLASLEQAEWVWRFNGSLPHGFARALTRCGDLLIEPWIVGRPLQDTSPERLAQAATLLRSLHAALPPRPADPSPYALEIARGLNELGQTGSLSAVDADRLQKLALSHCPQAVNEILMHQDFCAENLVIAPDDTLWMVDNDTLNWGPIELELARVRHRWPMPETDWLRFLQLYEAEEPSAFWHVLARLRGALARVRRQMPGATQAVERLRQLADGGDV